MSLPVITLDGVSDARTKTKTGHMPARTADNLRSDTGALFAAYLLIILIEYGGLSGFVPFLHESRLSTLLAWGTTLLVLKRVGMNAFTEFRQNRLLTLLLVWTAASVLWAVVRSYVPETFRFMCDYFGLFLISMYVVDRPSRARWLSIVTTVAILIVVARNLDNFNAGTRLVRFRASYFMGDGNDLAWAFSALSFAPVYLMVGKHPLGWRLFGAAGTVALIFAVVATQSRGGSIALGGALIYYWLFLSKRKVLGVASFVVLALALAAFAPPGYFDRMNSVQDYDEDGSAQGRIRAWKAAAQMGLDYPLGVGAGNFSSAYGRYYRPDNLVGYAVNRWISAHSVYFKIMGEYGYAGFLVLLTIIGSTLADNHRSAKRIRSDPEAYTISDRWPDSLNLGLVGYSLAAMFLGGVTYPHLFILTGLALGARRIVEQPAALQAAPAASGFEASLGSAPWWRDRAMPVVTTLRTSPPEQLLTAAWRGRRR